VNEHIQGKVDRKKKKRPLPTSGVEIFKGAKYVSEFYPININKHL
jgi:hypothetical protein